MTSEPRFFRMYTSSDFASTMSFALLPNFVIIYLFTDCNAAELDQEGIASRWSSTGMSKRASPVALITSPCRPEKYCKSSSKHLHALENLLVVRYRSADRLDLMLTRQFYVFLCEPKLRYILREKFCLVQEDRIISVMLWGVEEQDFRFSTNFLTVNWCAKQEVSRHNSAKRHRTICIVM